MKDVMKECCVNDKSMTDILGAMERREVKRAFMPVLCKLLVTNQQANTINASIR